MEGRKKALAGTGENMHYALMFVISMVSAAVQTVTGFGYGIIVMALFPLFLPMEQALMVSTVTSLCLNIAILTRRLRDVQFRLVWLPALFAFMGAYAGLVLVAEHPSPIYKRVLGLFLCLLAVWFIVFSKKVRLRGSVPSSAAAGAVSGICGGLFSISGPPMVLYYVSTIDDISHYLATTQFYFMVNNILIIALRAHLGLWPAGIAPACAVSLCGLLCGCFAGGRVLRKADGEKIRRAVYAVMVLAGLAIALGA